MANSTSSAMATPTPSPQEPDLPGPVLAAAAPRVVPDTTAVAARIRAIKVKGMTGTYSGSVVEVGTGKVLFAHNATASSDSGLNHEAAHRDSGAVDLGP